MALVENVNVERIAKLEAQVEGLKEDVADVKEDIKELYSRITTGNREIMDKIDQKIDDLAKKDAEQHNALKTTMEDVIARVDVLEKWRWMIMGGAIVLGYVIAHLKIDKLF